VELVMLIGDCSFEEGDHVRVRSEDAAVRYRKPHLRTPGAEFSLNTLTPNTHTCTASHGLLLQQAREARAVVQYAPHPDTWIIH